MPRDTTPEPTRLAAFAAQDAGASVADSRSTVAAEYGLTTGQLAAVEREGVGRQWPPLGETAEG